MGYISNKGVLAGPIQLNSYNSEDNNKLWLKATSVTLSEQNFKVLEVYNKDTTEVTTDYAPIYAKVPKIDYEKDSNYDNIVATIGWVRSNFSPNGQTDIPSFNPNDYVTISAFNDLKNIVTGNHENRIKLLEDNKIKLDKLYTDFYNYIQNPYPDGVIFVAGTAAEVK